MAFSLDSAVSKIVSCSMSTSQGIVRNSCQFYSGSTEVDLSQGQASQSSMDRITYWKRMWSDGLHVFVSCLLQPLIPDSGDCKLPPGCSGLSWVGRRRPSWQSRALGPESGAQVGPGQHQRLRWRCAKGMSLFVVVSGTCPWISIITGNSLGPECWRHLRLLPFAVPSIQGPLQWHHYPERNLHRPIFKPG